MLKPHVAVLLEARRHNLRLHRLEVDMRDFRLVAVEDLGDFFERGAARLDVGAADEDELEEDPDL